MLIRARLDKNESPRDIPESIKERVLSIAWRTDFARYQALNLGDLREALSGALDVPADSIVTGNGSDECILILSLAFGGPDTTVILPTPTFGTYGDAARWTGCRLAKVPRKEPDFDLDLEGIMSAALEADRLAPVSKRFASIVYLCRPNNPTGNACPESDIACILSVPRCLVVVDEAYYEFSGLSLVQWTKDWDNLIVLRTFSKAYSIAGLRVGYMIAWPVIAQVLDEYRLPYNVNVFSQAVALVTLEEREWFNDWAQTLAGSCRDLQRQMSRIQGVRPLPSLTNFVLFQTPLMAADLFQEFLDRGIVLRHYPNDPVLQYYLRVSVGTVEQNELFLYELRSILAGTHVH